MMIYWHFRNLQCILLAFFRPKIKNLRAPVTKYFWANPLDSDWMSSIQAGKFFMYTDAARWDIAIRSGFFKPALKNKWVVVLGGQKIIYRRPVKIFRRFSLTLQFVGWDNKWIYAAHVFRQNGQEKCCSFSKIGIRSKKGLVDPHEVFKSMGHTEAHPPPVYIQEYFSEDLKKLKELSSALPCS